MSKEYEFMLGFLKTATKEQLIELFHDIEDPLLIEKLGDYAYQYAEAFAEFEEENNYRELKQADDNQRYRDIKATQDNLK